MDEKQVNELYGYLLDDSNLITMGEISQAAQEIIDHIDDERFDSVIVYMGAGQMVNWVKSTQEFSETKIIIKK